MSEMWSMRFPRYTDGRFFPAAPDVPEVPQPEVVCVSHRFPPAEVPAHEEAPPWWSSFKHAPATPPDVGAPEAPVTLPAEVTYHVGRTQASASMDRGAFPSEVAAIEYATDPANDPRGRGLRVWRATRAKPIWEVIDAPTAAPAAGPEMVAPEFVRLLIDRADWSAGTVLALSYWKDGRAVLVRECGEHYALNPRDWVADDGPADDAGPEMVAMMLPREVVEMYAGRHVPTKASSRYLQLIEACAAALRGQPEQEVRKVHEADAIWSTILIYNDGGDHDNPPGSAFEDAAGQPEAGR